MRNKISVWLLVAGFGGASVGAQDLGGGWEVPPGRWWNSPRVAQELQLSTQQKAQLEEVTAQRLKTLIDLRAALQKASLELKLAADREPFDAKGVRDAFAAVQQARQRLERERFELLLSVRQVLTPEQWQRLRAVARERRELRLHREGPPEKRLGRPRP